VKKNRMITHLQNENKELKKKVGQYENYLGSVGAEMYEQSDS
jgi:hypothetical protein